LVELPGACLWFGKSSRLDVFGFTFRPPRQWPFIRFPWPSRLITQYRKCNRWPILLYLSVCS
jgi:hypothetical protein